MAPPMQTAAVTAEVDVRASAERLDFTSKALGAACGAAGPIMALSVRGEFNFL